MPVRIKDYIKSKTKSKLEITKGVEITAEQWKALSSGAIISGATGSAIDGKAYRVVRGNPINTTDDDSIVENEVAELLLIEITGGEEEAWDAYSSIISNFSATTTNTGAPHRPFVGYFAGRVECENYFDSIRTNSRGPIVDRLYAKYPGLQLQFGPI